MGDTHLQIVKNLFIIQGVSLLLTFKQLYQQHSVLEGETSTSAKFLSAIVIIIIITDVNIYLSTSVVHFLISLN